MSFGNTVTVAILGDTSDVLAKVTLVNAAVDEMTRKAKIARALVVQQVREGLTLISSMMSSFRMAMSLFGQTIDPFFSALVGMVLSTTSMLIRTLL